MGDNLLNMRKGIEDKQIATTLAECRNTANAQALGVSYSAEPLMVRMHKHQKKGNAQVTNTQGNTRKQKRQLPKHIQAMENKNTECHYHC